MVDAPAPDLPFRAARNGYSEGFGGVKGGHSQRTSQMFAKSFDFRFLVEDMAELSVYERFRQGSFGKGLLFFSNPFAFQSNLFAPAWAEPGLIEGDWENTSDATPSFASVSANSYDQPLRKATWAVTRTASTNPAYQSSSVVIPIPIGMTLWLGVSGATTGTGAHHVVATNLSTGVTTASNLTSLSDTSSTRLNQSFPASQFDYVEVFNDWRTSSAASTVTVTSRLAQLWPTGVTPPLSGNHIPGDGQTGLRFAGETYSHEYREWYGADRYTGVSFELVEVGAWLR